MLLLGIWSILLLVIGRRGLLLERVVRAERAVVEEGDPDRGGLVDLELDVQRVPHHADEQRQRKIGNDPVPPPLGLLGEREQRRLLLDLHLVLVGLGEGPVVLVAILVVPARQAIAGLTRG